MLAFLVYVLIAGYVYHFMYAYIGYIDSAWLKVSISILWPLLAIGYLVFAVVLCGYYIKNKTTSIKKDLT